ncbi:transmembrane emp24 domain-containing protein 1-like [Tigriopus californicus]|uniref:transmembrane emp24 domain-containing protein 1-like n=1 Tax=Tigriopus californicus TaxID=6832 RepID=UPI0027D9E623|nr:transmembrane emp24 domain-containing protein 1-like [Tigriopus californicus]
MAFSRAIWAFLVISLSVIMGQDPTDINWLEAAPGVAMEYKVHVDAGKEDCYFQFVHAGATLYVSYQVLKGGDGAIGFAVKDPQGKAVHPYAWKANSEYEENTATGGYYAVCLDNQFSKFSAKLVNLYLTTFRYDEWEKFAQELQDMDVTVQNFTTVLSGVDKRIQVMRQFQQLSRGLESRDYNLLEANLSYVSTWSLVQCAVVIVSGFTQVHFVKSLFNSDGRKTAGAKTQTRA